MTLTVASEPAGTIPLRLATPVAESQQVLAGAHLVAEWASEELGTVATAIVLLFLLLLSPVVFGGVLVAPCFIFIQAYSSSKCLVHTLEMRCVLKS